LVPAGGGEGRRITPGVVVESEEVGPLVIGSAVHVFCHLETVGVNISGGVTYGDLTVSTASNVLFHVTSDSLYVRCGSSGGVIVDNLVTREESQCVGVVGKSVNGCEDVLQVDGIVGWLWGATVEGVLWGVDVEHEVDSGLSKEVHASVMVLAVVDCVDTDSVDTELLEFCDITSAVRCGRNRVFELG
jgi:hypothetical protein